MDSEHLEPQESAIFVFEHHVRDDEIDVLGHVNNLAYLKWMQSAAVVALDCLRLDDGTLSKVWWWLGRAFA